MERKQQIPFPAAIWQPTCASFHSSARKTDVENVSRHSIDVEKRTATKGKHGVSPEHAEGT